MKHTSQFWKLLFSKEMTPWNPVILLGSLRKRFSSPSTVYTSPVWSSGHLPHYCRSTVTVNRSPPGCINLSCAVCFPFLSHTREGRVLICWQLLKIHIKSLLLFLPLLLLRHLSGHPLPGAQSRTMEKQSMPIKEALEQRRTELRDSVYICGVIVT